MTTADEAPLPIAQVPQIVTAVIRLVAPQAPAGILPDQNLIGDLGFHSLARAELGFTLEDLFELDSITPEEAMSMQTVGDITALIDDAVLHRGARMPTAEVVRELCAQYGQSWEPEPVG